MKEQPKPGEVIQFTDREEVREPVHCSHPPVSRGLFYRVRMVCKWTFGFFAYPLVIFAAAACISITAMIQCLVNAFKAIVNR